MKGQKCILKNLPRLQVANTPRHFATLHSTLRHFLACFLSIMNSDVVISSNVWPWGSMGWVYRGTGVSRGVWRTTWERSPKIWELQSKSLVLKSFSGEGTLWDSSLPVSLTLWDTPALFTPPLPLPQIPEGPGIEKIHSRSNA